MDLPHPTSTYILDTNIIRPLFKFYYPEDLFPEIWNGLNILDSQNRITSVKYVKDECMRQLPSFPDGEEWLDNHKDMFTSPTREEIEAFTEIISHKEFQLTPAELNIGGKLTENSGKQKTLADLFIVAKGMCTKGIVVTDETYKPIGRKIPTMCYRFGVECISRLEFIRRLREISTNTITR